MTVKQIRILSAADVDQCLEMSDAIQAMEAAFAQLSAGEAQVPLRTQLPVAAVEGTALFMPVYLPGNQRIALKTVTVFPRNPDRNLPLIHAMVQVLDGVTGAPLALMDGEVLTALRTGAAGGLATRLLAREDADTAAVIGAGVQGRTQLSAVCAVRPIRKAWVLDRSQDAAQSFAFEMSDRLGIPVEAANSPDVLSQARVICTATTSLEPVFQDHRISDGVHINAVGAYRPDMCEIPSETVQRARVIVDQVEGCRAEAGDLIQPIEAGIISSDHIKGELGEVVSGSLPGRQNPDQITLFKSVGNAVQDLAAASLVLDRAEARGLGTRVGI